VQLERGNPCRTAGEHNEIAISQREKAEAPAAAADGDK